MAVHNYLEEEDYDMPSTPTIFKIEDETSVSNPVLMADQSEYDEAAKPVPSSAEWREMADRGEVKGYEHPNKGKNPASQSKKKRKPGTKYHRRDITEKDLLVLAFLERFKLATTKQIAILLGVKRGSANWRLLGLKEIGLVGQEKMATMPVLWFLKPKGKTSLNNAFHFDERAPKNLHTPGAVSPSNISHILFEAQIAAQLAAGLKPLGKIESLEPLTGLGIITHLADETFLRKSWGTATYSKLHGLKSQAPRGYEISQRAADALQSGRVHYKDVLRENPSMWTITVPVGYRNECKDFHYPDLVVDLEHTRTGSAPVSYAVELELSPKSPQELQKILRTFKVAMEKSPVPIYQKVIYLIPNEGVKRGVISAAKAVGMTKDQLMIRPLFDFEGKEFTGKAWDL